MSGRLLQVVALLGVLATAATAADAGEEWHPCSGNGWMVTGASTEEQMLICKSVEEASEVLASCGVRTGSVTRIRVVEEMPLSCGVKVYGLYDSARDEILLGNPAICLAHASEGSLFDRIAPPLAFVAIAAHEATHAILYAGGLGADRHLEHEYIAAVVQMSVLPTAEREAILEPLRIGETVGIWELNPLIQALQPDRFVGLAWRHFEGEPDGCAYLRAMAEGTLRLEDFSPF